VTTGLSDEYLLGEGPEQPPRLDPPLLLEEGGIIPSKQRPKSEAQRVWLQNLIWSQQTMNKNSIAAKLRLVGEVERARLLEECHTTYTTGICTGCKKTNRFPNRCDHMLCPECQPRKAADREKAVGWWVARIDQPKLVTLTLINTVDFSSTEITQFKKDFTNLRGRKFCDNWVGGFYSMEVSNIGNGYHLHLHALVQAGWIDQKELSAQWKSVTKGRGYIVDVRDARALDYQKKVKKYIVKGSELASWTPEMIQKFFRAWEHHRAFGVFGSLYGARTQFREWWKTVRGTKPVCSCGCSEINYFSEIALIERDLIPDRLDSTIPPPPDTNTIPLALHFNAQLPPR
jgi:hypothetical protein